MRETEEKKKKKNRKKAKARKTKAKTSTESNGTRRTEFRQLPQQPRPQPPTTLNNIRRPSYQDIRSFLSGATVAVTATHLTQTATEETIAPTDTLISRCRAIRNRLQPPRSQVTQDHFLTGAPVAVTTTPAPPTATEETITPTDNPITRCSAALPPSHPPLAHMTHHTHISLTPHDH